MKEAFFSPEKHKLTMDICNRTELFTTERYAYILYFIVDIN